MLHRNVAKAQNYRVRFFSTKQLHLLILCTFSRFDESDFGESGLNPPYFRLRSVYDVILSTNKITKVYSRI